MITKTPTNALSSSERSQVDRIQLARGAWKEGRPGDALILIQSVKDEEMSRRVAAECYVAEAAFLAERGDFERSLESLKMAAPLVDFAPTSVRAAFHHQRARARKELAMPDAALTDYSGAAALWESEGSSEKQGAATLNVAGCYLALGDLEAAHASLDKALALLVGSFYLPHAYDTQARIFLAEGKLGHAAKAIAKALSIVTSNDQWTADFHATQEEIEKRLLEALEVKHFADWDRVRINMVRRALQEAEGSPARAALTLGVTHHAICSVINTHKEDLERYRNPKRVRRKSIIKAS